MQKNYVQEILSIIHSGLPKAELAEKLSDYHEKDLADALEVLTPAERQSLYSILGVDTVAEIFTYLDDAEPYLKELPSHEAAKVMPFSTAKQSSAWGFAPQLLSPPTPRWKAAHRTIVLLSSRGSS